MSRLVKILLYAVVLFLIFLWLSTIYKSCNKEKITAVPDIEVTAEEPTYAADDFFEEENTSETSEDDLVEENNSDIDYTEIDKVIEEKKNEQQPEATKPTTSVTTLPTPKPSVDNGTTSGKYMVIAGSYLIEDNARKMQNRLNEIGYDQSDIVVFDLSQYHSVVAARYNSYDKALKVSNELKRRGIECYVHAKQY